MHTVIQLMGTGNLLSIYQILSTCSWSPKCVCLSHSDWWRYKSERRILPTEHLKKTDRDADWFSKTEECESKCEMKYRWKWLASDSFNININISWMKKTNILCLWHFLQLPKNQIFRDISEFDRRKIYFVNNLRF